ncbi:MAG TPA: PotD/PotF family extracellular solute-binding protein [Nitrospiraceae bacterium]
MMPFLRDCAKNFGATAVASGCAILLVLSASPVNSQTMEQIVEGAKKEGEVRITITVRTKEGNIVAAPRLIEAFQKRYPFVKVHHTRVGGSREREKIFTELVSGMVSYDVATLGLTSVPDGIRADIFHKVDWKGFGVDPNRFHPASVGVKYRLQLYGLSYNMDKMSKAEAEKLTWESCADPRYRGKVAYNVRPRHLEILYQDDGWGEKATLEHARRVKANKPIFEKDRTGMQSRLSDGAYVFICGQYWSTFQRARLGEGVKNVGFVVPEPALISGGDLVFVPKGAKNPNAAILWILWSTSDEGMNLLDEVQFSGDPAVPGASAHHLVKNKKVIRGSWEYQARASKILRAILSEMGVPVAR